MQGRCDCGAVGIRVSRPPTAVTQCGCGICRRYGALWAYYPIGEVEFSGPMASHMRGPRRVAFERCAVCGCVVGWRPRGRYPECAVNARMFDDLDLAAVEVFVEDDASV